MIAELAALKESTKSAHKRLDKNDRIIEEIHKLTASVETLALQVKLLTEKMDVNIARLEAGQKRTGERLSALEKEPATKWKAVTAQVTALIIAAIMGGILINFIR